MMVKSLQGYEFVWEGLAKNTDHGDLKLWGRGDLPSDG